ncbi:hypothetical protein KSP40_PGU012990 [Platanthera guangdongensis]|uniref:Uncharacterized protein n=1 Tax=Platanthera guangdongensis TaxID=2320717 RepID=A0ABR2MYS1_9ASPA
MLLDDLRDLFEIGFPIPTMRGSDRYFEILWCVDFSVHSTGSGTPHGIGCLFS